MMLLSCNSRLFELEQEILLQAQTLANKHRSSFREEELWESGRCPRKIWPDSNQPMQSFLWRRSGRRSRRRSWRSQADGKEMKNHIDGTNCVLSLQSAPTNTQANTGREWISIPCLYIYCRALNFSFPSVTKNHIDGTNCVLSLKSAPTNTQTNTGREWISIPCLHINCRALNFRFQCRAGPFNKCIPEELRKLLWTQKAEDADLHITAEMMGARPRAQQRKVVANVKNQMPESVSGSASGAAGGSDADGSGDADVSAGIYDTPSAAQQCTTSAAPAEAVPPTAEAELPAAAWQRSRWPPRPQWAGGGSSPADVTPSSTPTAAAPAAVTVAPAAALSQYGSHGCSAGGGGGWAVSGGMSSAIAPLGLSAAAVPPSFPRSVSARAFYAVLELPAAVRASSRDGLDLGVLPPVTIFARPYRCPASGFGRYSSVRKPSLDGGFLQSCSRSANIREYVRNHLPALSAAHRKKKGSLPIQGLLVACR